MRRRVALKIVRLGMNTEGVIARFGIERQALALMDHPNIAKVLDAGTTASGRPYFVMELVTGEKITTYCDRKKLGNSQRLNLFIQVCNAIQHAHQKGIIHRDIKPSNILVTEQDGRELPKVIDFGIAKATESQSLGQKVHTSHDQFVGTPAYMSPEQIDMAGLDVDTRSDVYSLGVLLYELLTSKTPLDSGELASYGISKIRHTVMTNVAPRPSQMLEGVENAALQELAKDRKSEPAQLISSVRGDLDWIVMKAMEKERSRRYQTVNSLALDVQRYLEHQPVSASPPGKLYLLGKFIRRNRIAFGAGLSLTIMLVAGLVVSTTLYERERRARNEQLRLKEEAQRAKNEESRLRRQADARANVARAAFLLDQGRIDEADALRREYPLSSIEPSLEAAAVFRSLGDWNADHGEWDQAVECFRLLMQANRFDIPQKTLQGSDLMAISAILLRQSQDEYIAFRNEVISHYLPASQNALQAEHLLKVCLLRPTSAEHLEKLHHALAVMGEPEEAPLQSWAGLSLALYHYRDGKPHEALEACGQGLDDPQIKTSCRTTIKAVASMIHTSLGRTEDAKRELQEAATLAKESAGNDFIAGKPEPPYWFDWVIADALIKEARKRLRETSVDQPW